MIDISTLQKPQVLAALYNASKPQGMGILSFTPQDMTEAEASEILSQQTDFDYMNGRIMKVDLSGDSFDPWLYDRDNGSGAALRALQPLFEKATA